MNEQFKAATLFFVFLVSFADLSWAAPTETTIAGRAISVSLVKVDDLSSAPWPDDASQLTIETVVTQANANIFDLLTASGIEPDVEAFTIVYDLNPSLMQVDPLPSGVNLVLPKVTGEKFQDKIRHGYLVMLTVDSALREELARSSSELQDLSSQFAGLPADRFASPSTKQEMLSNI